MFSSVCLALHKHSFKHLHMEQQRLYNLHTHKDHSLFNWMFWYLAQNGISEITGKNLGFRNKQKNQTCVLNIVICPTPNTRRKL